MKQFIKTYFVDLVGELLQGNIHEKILGGVITISLLASLYMVILIVVQVVWDRFVDKKIAEKSNKTINQKI